MSGEVRVVSATGGEKGQKAEQIGTVDPLSLMGLARVSGFGARKYEAFNYLKGYNWDLSYDAAQRHLMKFWNGEDRDECEADCEPDCNVHSGELHVLHAAWHCLAMASFIERGLGTDNRYKAEVEAKVVSTEKPDPIGCELTVTGDRGNIRHCFQVGEAVRVVGQRFNNRWGFILDCESLDTGVSWWVCEGDLA